MEAWEWVGRDYAAGCQSRNLSLILLAAVQNRVNSRSELMLILGKRYRKMRSISPHRWVYPSLEPRRCPWRARARRLISSGYDPFVTTDRSWHSAPRGCVSSPLCAHLLLRIAVSISSRHWSRYQMLPLGRSVIVHVSAVTLSPRRAKVRPRLPRMTCPTTFW